MTPTAEALRVVLVHWNEPRRCADTVAAFLAQTVPVAITVVDNGSVPEVQAALGALEARHPEVEVLALGQNSGFGPAANAGIRRWLDGGEGDWVAVAPHDARPATDCCERVLTALAWRGRAGLACADVGDGHVPVIDPYFGGMTVPAEPGTAMGWVGAGYPHGTLLFARRRCLEDIGLFDERYFAYCEEADLAQRARERGWASGLVRGAGVTNTHLGGGTAVVDYLKLRNTLLFVRSHYGRYKATVRLLIAVGQLVKGVGMPSLRPLIFVPAARVRAMLDYCRGRFGPPPEELAPLPIRAGRRGRRPPGRR